MKVWLQCCRKDLRSEVRKQVLVMTKSFSLQCQCDWCCSCNVTILRRKYHISFRSRAGCQAQVIDSSPHNLKVGLGLMQKRSSPNQQNFYLFPFPHMHSPLLELLKSFDWFHYSLSLAWLSTSFEAAWLAPVRWGQRGQERIGLAWAGDCHWGRPLTASQFPVSCSPLRRLLLLHDITTRRLYSAPRLWLG